MLGELRITPVGDRPDLRSQVAKVVQVLEKSPLSYQVHAMGTTLEGEMDDILDVFKRCHEKLRHGAKRVLLELAVDDRLVEPGELRRSLDHLREAAGDTPLERVAASD